MNELSWRVWAPLTLLPLSVQLLVWGLAPTSWFYLRLVESEFGYVELGTALLLLPAAWFALVTAKRSRKLGLVLLPFMLVLFAAGSLFLCGEEISYGQHLFEWGTPDYFAENNRQQETNLHNLESFDKNTLKWIVVIGIGALGLLALFRDSLKRRGGFWADGRSAIHLVPTYVVTAAAIMTLGMHIVTKKLKIEAFITVNEGGINLRETVELYISIVFFLFAWSLARRFKAEAPA